MHIFRRLWEVAKNRKKFRPDPTDRAGRTAELKTASLLEKRLDGTNIDVWASRRIPDHVTGRRREFDFILAFPTSLLVIELKNWSGTVEQRDGRLLQHRPTGDVVDHGHLFESLDDRLRTLRDFLEDRGVDVGHMGRIRSLLVFSNPNTRLSEDLDPGRHEIFLFSDVLQKQSLPSRGLSTNGSFIAEALWQLIDELTDEELGDDIDETAEPTPVVRRAREVLDATGTWDVLELYGGRTLAGDVRRCLEDDEHPLSDRDGLERLDVDVSRSYWKALTEAPAIEIEGHRRDGDDAVEFDDLQLGDTLEFHAAGDRSSTTVPLRHVESLTYGYTGRAAHSLSWEDLERGKQYTGRVKNIVDFGLFVDIGGPTDGLLHISKVNSNRYTKPFELHRRFNEGDIVEVRLLGIDPDEEELDLALLHHRQR